MLEPLAILLRHGFRGRSVGQGVIECFKFVERGGRVQQGVFDVFDFVINKVGRIGGQGDAGIFL